MGGKIERIRTSLQFDDNIDLHVLGWKLQRWWWGLMLAFLILALLGLFGDGPLSDEQMILGTTTANYERFIRRENDTEMEITAAAVNGGIHVSLSPDFHRIYRIEGMIPEPDRQTIRDGATVFEFPATGQARITMFLTVREHVGRAATTIVVNGSTFYLRSYVYP